MWLSHHCRQLHARSHKGMAWTQVCLFVPSTSLTSRNVLVTLRMRSRLLLHQMVFSYGGVPTLRGLVWLNTAPWLPVMSLGTPGSPPSLEPSLPCSSCMAP